MKSHMIQRLVIELNTSGLKNALEMERKASEYNDQIIEPALETCFNDFKFSDRYLFIDSLDIDLGFFTTDSFKNEARERLIKQLGTHLKQIGRRHTGYKQQGDSTVLNRNDSGTRQRPSTGMSEEISAVKTVSYYNALLSFLERGRFPWWFEVGQLPKKIDTEFGTKWDASTGKPEAAHLKRYLLQSAVARCRLASGFSPEWTGKLLQKIGLAGNDARILWDILQPAFQISPQLMPLFRYYFWVSWIEYVGKEDGPLEIESILKAVTRNENRLFRKLYAKIHTISQNARERTDLPDRVRLALIRLDSHGTRGTRRKLTAKPIRKGMEGQTGRGQPDMEITANGPGEAGQTVNNDLKWYAGKQKVSIPTDKTVAGIKTYSSHDKGIEPIQTHMDFDEREPLFLQAAGMVLLHPFLPELFEKRGLWNGKNWLFDDAPNQAVCLLSCLSYNEVDLPEHRLLFHKILVGLEPESMMLPVPIPGPDETASCDELLKAVIGHWKALRNTSPDGLRELFLKREGRLVTGDKGYVLHIEKKTEDILLSRLPWGYSLVKLPWMDKILNVSWV